MARVGSSDGDEVQGKSSRTNSRRTRFRQMPIEFHGADQREPAKGRSVVVDGLLEIDTLGNASERNGTRTGAV